MKISLPIPIPFPDWDAGIDSITAVNYKKKRKEEEGGGLGGSHQEEEEENDPLFLGLCRASSRDSAAAAVRLRQLWSETRRDECVHISFIFRPIQNISYDKMAYLPSAMN
jgi:hypothetical protein